MTFGQSTEKVKHKIQKVEKRLKELQDEAAVQGVAVEALFFFHPVKTQVPDIGIGRKAAAGMAEPGEGGLKQCAGNGVGHDVLREAIVSQAVCRREADRSIFRVGCHADPFGQSSQEPRHVQTKTPYKEVRHA